MRRAVTHAVLAACVALGGCRGRNRPTPPEDRAAAWLRLFPASARFVVGLDVARLRAAPITARLGALHDVFAPAASRIEALTAATGFDPWGQVEGIAMGGVSATNEVAWVIRGRGLDEALLTDYARAHLAASGDELIGRPYRKRTLWSTRKSPDSAAVFLDPGTLVIATGWAERIVDVADGVAGARSAASNPELVASSASVAASPLWGAGVLPESARDYLEGDFRVRSIASMRQVTVAVDLDPALVAKLAIAFGDAAQADELAEEAAELLDRARRERRDSPIYQKLFKGLTEYADGSTFRAELRVEPDIAVQIAEGLARFANLTKQPTELPQPKARALTFKPDWLSPPPKTIALGDVRSFDAWDRQAHALIEVVNRSDKPVLPEIVIRYRDQNDKRLDERMCVVPMLVLLAHESAACDPGIPDTAATGIYTIRTAPDERAATFASGSRATLKILGARLESLRGPSQWLLGDVKNDTTAAIRGARVHATFYDADHKIVGYGDAALEQREIAPGARAHFSVASGPLAGPVKSFGAIAYSLRRAGTK